jgi:hypothetical protein
VLNYNFKPPAHCVGGFLFAQTSTIDKKIVEPMDLKKGFMEKNNLLRLSFSSSTP